MELSGAVLMWQKTRQSEMAASSISVAKQDTWCEEDDVEGLVGRRDEAMKFIAPPRTRVRCFETFYLTSFTT